MKRIFPATLIAAVLAIGFGAIAANAATSANTQAIVAEAPTGTEAAETPGDTTLDPAGGLESQVNFQGDSQLEQ